MRVPVQACDVSMRMFTLDAVAYFQPVLLERSAVKRDMLRSEFSACQSKHST